MTRDELAIIMTVTLNNILHELWMEGVNMGGEYQGVWVRFRDIERIMKKHMEEEKE